VNTKPRALNTQCVHTKEKLFVDARVLERANRREVKFSLEKFLERQKSYPNHKKTPEEPLCVYYLSIAASTSLAQVPNKRAWQAIIS